MAHTQDMLVCDASGNVFMIVIPDDDAQLKDPAFNPAGFIAVKVAHDPKADIIAAAAQARPDLNVKLADAPIDIPVGDAKPIADVGAAEAAVAIP